MWSKKRNQRPNDISELKAYVKEKNDKTNNIEMPGR